MQSNIVVTTPVSNIDLITLTELKTALKITDTIYDQMLSDIITRVSDEIAALCNNRVFGKEAVVETFTEIPCDCHRLFLARFPIRAQDIVSISSGGGTLAISDYLLDSKWGKVTYPNGKVFVEQTVFTYSGGFNLPDEAPPALKQAAVLLAREAYYAALRGDQSVRMIGHKESRIIYFDPNVLARAALGGGSAQGSPATRAALAILSHFTRYEA
jgi:hypothetical protein